MPPQVIAMREPNEPTISKPRLLSSGRYVHFGPFRIDQQRQELTRNGVPLKLQGKVYQALLTLLEKPRELVTREELRLRLWPDETHVNYDANVNTTVNKLRIALGDSPDTPLYIETIPRKGYCILVQPEVSGMLGNQLRDERPAEDAEVSSQTIAVSRFSKSALWMVVAAVGLILAGMILGAGIMSLWINHASRLPRAAAGFELNYGRSPSGSFTAPSIKPLSLDQWAESGTCMGQGAHPFASPLNFMRVFLSNEVRRDSRGVRDRWNSLQNLEVSNERLPIGVS